MTRKILISILVIVSLFGVTFTAWAGGKNNKDVYIPKDQVIVGNYYNAAATIEIAGKVESDVYLAGGNIVISGEVGGDVLAVGGNIRITGKVNGNVRAIGGTVDISGPVTKNVSVLSGTLIVSETSNISGHVSVMTGALDMRGAIKGNVDAGVGDAIVAGTVGGQMKLNIDREGGLKVRESAILGGLEYKSVKEAEIASGAQISGDVKYNPYTYNRRHAGTNWLGWLISIFSLIAVASLFVGIVPKLVKQVAVEAFEKPWLKIGWGLVWLIVIPIASILLMVTIIGIPIALMIMVGYFIVLYVAQIFIGAIIVEYLKSKTMFSFLQKWPALLSIVLGIVIFKLISVVPVIGWILCFMAVLWVWGTIVKVKTQLISNFR